MNRDKFKDEAASIRAQLAAEERQLRDLTDKIQVMVTRCSRDLHYLFVNRAYAEFLGCPAEQIVGRPISEVVGTAAFEAIRPYIDRVLAGERTEYEVEIPLADAGPHYILVVYVPDFDASENVCGWTATISDITERKRAEEALRRSEARLTAFLEQLPVGVGAMDIEGRWTIVNPAMRIYVPETIPSRDGKRRDRWQTFDAQGRPIPPGNWPSARALRGERVEQGMEMLYTTDDGRQIWTRVKALPKYNSAGERSGAIAIVEDIDAIKRAEDALRCADRRKDEFLATLAHELRNPLASIVNALRVMEHPQGGSETREVLPIMHRQVAHMVRMIDDLMDISRITRDILELRLERTELKSLVGSSVEALLPLVSELGHEIVINLPADPVYLDADPLRLAQVFDNLLSNACKYTQRGGRIEVSANLEPDEVVVSVKDNGIGIQPADQPGMFRIFGQIDRAVNRGQGGGLGIGLYLAERLIGLHGGSISVHSEGQGKGSEFRVRLPLAGAAAPQPCVRQPAIASDARRTFRILIVDDNRDASESLALLFNLTGHQAQAVHDGPAAIEKARTWKPEVILLDIGMPLMDGYEVCRRLREQPWSRGITIISLTGWGQQSDREKSRNAGFDSHQVKPVDYETLMKLISNLRTSPGVEDSLQRRTP